MKRLGGYFREHPVWATAAALIVAFLLYFNLFADRRYVSEAHVIVDNLQTQSNPLPDVSSLVSGVSSSSRDVFLLRDYIQSTDMAARLEQRLGLRVHYSSSYDPFSRMAWRDIPLEWFMSHYRTRVTATFDELSGVLVVQAQAYTPRMAHAIGQALVEEGERFMNGMAQKLMREQVAYAEREVADASQRMASSRQRLLAYQNRFGLVSPTATVESIAATVARLEGEQSDLEARRHAMEAYLAPGAPDLVQVNEQITAVGKQIKAQRSKLASTQGGPLNRVAEEYDRLALEASFQQDIYRTSLAALERARVDATRTLRKISVLQTPTVPEYSTEPGRLYNSALFAIGTLLLAGIAQLLLSIIREHRD